MSSILGSVAVFRQHSEDVISTAGPALDLRHHELTFDGKAATNVVVYTWRDLVQLCKRAAATDKLCKSIGCSLDLYMSDAK